MRRTRSEVPIAEESCDSDEDQASVTTVEDDDSETDGMYHSDSDVPNDSVKPAMTAGATSYVKAVLLFMNAVSLIALLSLCVYLLFFLK